MNFSDFVSFLILFPFFLAIILSFIPKKNIRKFAVYTGSFIIMAVTVVFSVLAFSSGTIVLLPSTHIIDLLMLIGEFSLLILVTILGIKYKKYYVVILSVLQTFLLAWTEYRYPANRPLTHILCDNFTIIMCLIIAIIGCLICIYAVGYMSAYHNHHSEYKDRQTFFFPMLFVFIGAMFGLVLSSNIIWIYFFWEITSIVSFLLIGYTRTKEAITNSFRALWMNLLGGLAFAIGIYLIVSTMHVYNLQDLVKSNSLFALLPVALLAFAGLTKSAQLPFSKWLLGAMAAPTPTSALLHSATMVKAGVYLLLRLSPALAGNTSGTMVSLIGGFTFFIASMLAITKSDGKKVLAYSTISNLGLITACAGVGMNETVWAGILLMIFHAASKSMLFQTVGAIENATGSRNIEDMHGLIVKLPHLALIMVIGIAGMFLAPFGMLISKWAALKSFIDADNSVLVCFLCFGSATTLVYWTKWLSKILSCVPGIKPIDDKATHGQWLSLKVHAGIMVILCIAFPFISRYTLIPLLTDMFGNSDFVALSSEDMIIMITMLAFIFFVPAISKFILRNINLKPSLEYMSGINEGDNRMFVDSFKGDKKMYLSGWYMSKYFGEKRLWTPSVCITSLIIILCIATTIGGVL